MVLILTLVTQIGDAPTVITLRYLSRGEARDIVKARLDAAQGLLEAAWPDTARHDLIIERTIAEAQ